MKQLSSTVEEASNELGHEFIDYAGIIAAKGSGAEIVKGINTGILKFPFANKRLEVPKGIWIMTLDGEKAESF